MPGPKINKKPLAIPSNVKLNAKLVDKLKKRNKELLESRRAALNLLEEAILLKDIAQKAKEKYKTLFNNMQQGFCIVEVMFDKKQKAVDYRFLEVNPVFETQTGLHNAAGKTMRELQPALEEHWFYTYGQVAMTGKAVHFENFASLLNGVWYEVFAFPFGEPGKNEVAILFNDVTGRKNVEEALRRSEEQLKQFNVLLEQDVAKRTSELKLSRENLFEKNRQLEYTIAQLESFNYIASHDLREPLRKIQTYVSMMNRNRDDAAKLNHHLNSISDASKRMGHLIEDLLNYSRLSRPVEVFQPVDLNKVLHNAKEDHEVLINEKKANLESDNLPVVSAISFQMDQLFANLISNALKFNEGRPIIKITARIIPGTKIKTSGKFNPGRKYAEIIFSDNGIGFDNQYSEKIFELFQRLHDRSTYSGTGIGLSIVDKIVKNHNGFVKAEGVEGKGARFTVYLPA